MLRQILKLVPPHIRIKLEEKFGASPKASYLRDAVLSSNDGLITTFAVIAGVQGAGLPYSVIVILGVANLFADGFSMASGNYQAIKSEQDYDNNNGLKIKKSDLIIGLHALVTFFSFALVGSIPLFPFLFNLENAFAIASISMLLTLIAIGAVRGKYSNGAVVWRILETVLIGFIAATIAYTMGSLAEGFLNK